MRTQILAAFLAIIANGQMMGQQPAVVSAAREWTNTEGRKISAEYLGTQGLNVVLKKADGKIVSIPVTSLSEADKTFILANALAYQEEWKAWPLSIEKDSPTVRVTETKVADGKYTYETPHFRYTVDGNLGGVLMKDLAYVFELTYFLNSQSPFGVLATPDGDRFEAKLFGDSKAYADAGGPTNSAGVYFLKNRQFLARLDLMGVRVDGSVWRKIPRSRSDTTTIIHELTHMLTHEMLITLPIWFNEGYAEYISSIPIENEVFRVSPEKIREGTIETFILDYEKWNSGSGRKIVKLGPADRSKFLKESLPAIPPVSSVLGMLDTTWEALSPQFTLSIRSSKFSYEQKMGVYRTCQLILYYFMHLDGDKGVTKLRNYVSFNQKKHKDLLAYRAAHEEYVRKFDNFKKLPGVQDLGNGQIRYPSILTPPTAPNAPTDPESSLNSGMDILYAGEAPDALARKIQQALVADLGLQLQFTLNLNLNPRLLIPVRPPFPPLK